MTEMSPALAALRVHWRFGGRIRELGRLSAPEGMSRRSPISPESPELRSCMIFAALVSPWLPESPPIFRERVRRWLVNSVDSERGPFRSAVEESTPPA